MLIEQWDKDPEFKAFPTEEKSRILSNYFDREMADDEFRGLPENEQVRIRNNFLTSEGFSSEPTEREDLGARDYGLGIAKAAAKTGSNWGFALEYPGKAKRLATDFLLKKVGIDTPSPPGIKELAGRKLSELSEKAADYYEGETSEAYKVAEKQPILAPEGQDGIFNKDLGIHKVGSMIVGSIPETVIGMGGGAAITQKLIGGGLKHMPRILIKPLSKIAGEKAALGIVGGAIGEGATAGLANAHEIYNEINDINPEELVKSDTYKYINSQIEKAYPNPEERHDKTKEVLSMVGAAGVGVTTAITTLILGAPSGAVTGKILGGEGKSILRNIINSAITEGFVEENLQSGAEKIISNVTTKYLADKNIKPFEGVGEAMASGTISGLAMGGGMAIPASIAGRGEGQEETFKQKQPQVDQEDLALKVKQIKAGLNKGETTLAQLREALKQLPEDHIHALAINEALKDESPTSRPIDLTGPKQTSADFLLRMQNQEKIDQFEAEQAQAEQAAELEAQAQDEAEKQAEEQYWERQAGDIRGQQLAQRIGLTRPTTVQQPIEDVSREAVTAPEKTDVALESAVTPIESTKAEKLEPIADDSMADGKIPSEPSKKQIKAGNYKKSHIKVHGLDITIENPHGSIRTGVSTDGTPWSTKMLGSYGYFKRTEGKDGDQIDTFIGPDIESPNVYIVDQVDPKTGKFDEHKVMTGFPSTEAAKEGYLANYDEGWQGLDNITEMPVDEFKQWLSKGKQKKPVALLASDRRTKQLKGLRIKNKRTGQERRADVAARKKVSEMSPEEKDAALLTDELTGLKNKRAYNESEKKEVQASLDVDSLKWVNDTFGHDSGDKLLKTIGNALKVATDDTYHVSGDEFIIQSDRIENVDNITKKAYDYLKEHPVSLEYPDGTKTTYIAGFSYGTGKTFKEADQALKAHKVERELKGFRSKRGKKPARGLEERTGRDEVRSGRRGLRHKVTSQPTEDSHQTKEARSEAVESIKSETQPVAPERKEAGKKAAQAEPAPQEKDKTQIQPELKLKKKAEQYSTKTSFKDSNISLKDLQELFEHQKVKQLSDGSVSVKTALGKGFVIKFVETITPDKAAFHAGYGRTKGSGELIAGKYKDGVVTISRIGDIWTVAHEGHGHWAEEMGFINGNDQRALSFEIKRRVKRGKWKTLNPDNVGGKEDRAEFIAQELKERSHTRPTVQRIIQKLQDLIDSLVNLYKRTAKGVTRDIESGKIYDKKGIPATKKTPSYEKTAQRWYSQMEKTLEQKLPGKGTPESMLQSINAFAKKGEFKSEELSWSGVEDWLSEQKGKVTKQQVLDYLKNNNVQIREVVKGEPTESDIDILLDDELGEGFTREEAREYLQNDEGATKFSQYTEPGGTNYKEVLLTLPEKQPKLPETTNDYAQMLFKKNFPELREDQKEKVTQQMRVDDGIMRRQERYTGGHWAEPNVLAHLRLNERTDSEGNKVMFLEEIQSDYGAEYRKQLTNIENSVTNNFKGIVKKMETLGILEEIC